MGQTQLAAPPRTVPVIQPRTQLQARPTIQEVQEITTGVFAPPRQLAHERLIKAPVSARQEVHERLVVRPASARQGVTAKRFTPLRPPPTLSPAGSLVAIPALPQPKTSSYSLGQAFPAHERRPSPRHTSAAKTISPRYSMA